MAERAQDDGCDHIREQVKKLAAQAMVGVRQNGVSVIGEANLLCFQLVARREYAEPDWQTVTDAFMTTMWFALHRKEIKESSPERLADLVECRFRCALDDLWNLLTQQTHALNMQLLLSKEKG